MRSYNVANECITFFHCTPSDAVYNRKIKFLSELKCTDDTVSKLLEKIFVNYLPVLTLELCQVSVYMLSELSYHVFFFSFLCVLPLLVNKAD